MNIIKIGINKPMESGHNKPDTNFNYTLQDLQNLLIENINNLQSEINNLSYTMEYFTKHNSYGINKPLFLTEYDNINKAIKDYKNKVLSI